MKDEFGIGYTAPPDWGKQYLVFIADSDAQHMAVIEWLYQCVSNCESNVHCFKLISYTYVTFRRPKDEVMFLLRWGGSRVYF